MAWLVKRIPPTSAAVLPRRPTLHRPVVRARSGPSGGLGSTMPDAAEGAGVTEIEEGGRGAAAAPVQPASSAAQTRGPDAMREASASACEGANVEDDDGEGERKVVYNTAGTKVIGVVGDIQPDAEAGEASETSADAYAEEISSGGVRSDRTSASYEAGIPAAPFKMASCTSQTPDQAVSPSRQRDHATVLTVLTLNTWGLWLVSKVRKQRMQQLCRWLEQAAEDVVLLQEVWVDSDAEQLMSRARGSGLAHSIHFKSGMFGSGLVTLSRHPILAWGFQRYAASGDPAALLCGDFYAAKGVGWVLLSTPGGPMAVFNTHLHANYSHKVRPHPGLPEPTLTTQGQKPQTQMQAAAAAAAAAAVGTAVSGAAGTAAGAAAAGAAGAAAAGPARAAAAGAPSAELTWATLQRLGVSVPHDSFAAFRLSQVLQLAQLVRQVHAAAGCPALVLGGDLNTKPHHLEMALLKWVGAGSGAGTNVQAMVPERIDYIFVSGMEPMAVCVTLHATSLGISYSDHLAVQARLRFPMPSLPNPDVPALAAADAVSAAHSTLATDRADKAKCATDVAQFERAVLHATRELLARGCDLAAKYAKHRCGLAVLMAILAAGCAASSARALWSRLMPFSQICSEAEAPYYTLAFAANLVELISAPILAGCAVIMLVMGAVGDTTQRRVLAMDIRAMDDVLANGRR
ncbi:hypothetical protein QJQ45_009322 [Haematococcus lacustris]|nr:hypothetical protein QJQ45_009322 [Haematococcus lacustris]